MRFGKEAEGVCLRFQVSRAAAQHVPVRGAVGARGSSRGARAATRHAAVRAHPATVHDASTSSG